MQSDMHYYGTYALVRAAGLAPAACKTIATAAQFVDDNAGKDAIKFADGARLDVDATAHHAFDNANIDAEDQRQVWVPFHFMPGNEGREYTEKLICRMDNALAREMVAHHVAHASRDYYLPLMGIAAHVYADAFSHYGFSGVSSRKNRIVADSMNIVNEDRIGSSLLDYIETKATAFRHRYGREGGFMPNIKRLWNSAKSEAAEVGSGALGHGAVLTYPDRPYLHWQFTYEDRSGSSRKSVQDRNNPETFMRGCEALHAMFTDVRTTWDGTGADNGRTWRQIAERVKAIIETPGRKKDRIRNWQHAAKAGDLFASGAEPIPSYNANVWHRQREKPARDGALSGTAIRQPVFQFYQAAAAHRIYVLRELLPRHGLLGN